MSGSLGKVTGRCKGPTEVSGGRQADGRSGAAGREMGPGGAEARGDCYWNWAETPRWGPGGRALTPPRLPPTSASAHVTLCRPGATGKPAARRRFPLRCGSAALPLQVARGRVLHCPAGKGSARGARLPRETAVAPAPGSLRRGRWGAAPYAPDRGGGGWGW